MPPRLSPAQLTWLLKGHLKNVQVAYLRAGALLAKIRDEKLYRALRYADMESYAADRLGLQLTSLYRYLEIYDWVRGAHPEWLAKHPKGFIPELSDAQALQRIEARLADPNLEPATRAELEALQKKALAGKLTRSEFEEFRRRGKKRHDTLRALAASIVALHRRAARARRHTSGGAPGFRFRARSPESRVRRTRGGHSLGKRVLDAGFRAVAEKSHRRDPTAMNHGEIVGFLSTPPFIVADSPACAARGG